jgi:hypothetical protein
VVLILSSAYLLVGVLGLILIDTSANVLAINQADNVLHLAVGALGIGVVGRLRQTGDTDGASLSPWPPRAGMGYGWDPILSRVPPRNWDMQARM